MTRKDYKRIASAIKQARFGLLGLSEPLVRVQREIALREVTRKLADALQGDNPRFSRGKFIEACGFFEHEMA